MSILLVGLDFVLIYLVFAIVVSGAQEWWSQWFGQRGKFMSIGIRRLIDDDAIFARVLQHPLVAGLYRVRGGLGKPPSYIEPDNFALALANVLVRRTPAGENGVTAPPPLTYASLRAAVTTIAEQNSPAAYSLLPILDKADGKLDVALDGIEAWFSGGMDRVSGWYKAYSQKRLFVFGLCIAIVANVDTIEIYRALSRDSGLAARIGDHAQAVARSGQIGTVDLSTLEHRELSPEESKMVLKAALAAPEIGLPIGYACLSVPLIAANGASKPTDSAYQRCSTEIRDRVDAWSASDWLVHLLGWILTALAGTLGAPYWFAALVKVVDIRGSGPKPESK